MESSNSDKAKAGINTALELLNLLEKIVNKYNSLSLEKNIEYGMPEMDPKQFKANAKINFDNNNLSWLIVVSSSFRSDRLKGKEFDIEHIKAILNNKKIATKAYFLLPDNAKSTDIRDIEVFNKHIKLKDKVTYFDGAMLMTEFRNILEQKATKHMQQGIRSNILGKSAEDILYQTFKNINNIKIWNNSENNLIQSSNYALFKTVITKLCPNIGKILSCTALNANDTKDLKIVRNFQNKIYGMPKTDIIISLIGINNKHYDFKISVKHPNLTKGKITVHECSIERLLADLKKSLPVNSIFNNPNMFAKLSASLMNFQQVGSKAKMDLEKLEFLNTYLYSLNKWLIDYFLFGINNSYLNKNQQADALLVFNPETGECTINTVRDTEINLLNATKRTFNTPFSWTYPSKKRGKKIQIKSPIFLQR